VDDDMLGYVEMKVDNQFLSNPRVDNIDNTKSCGETDTSPLSKPTQTTVSPSYKQQGHSNSPPRRS
jgi:hypothetical protein